MVKAARLLVLPIVLVFALVTAAGANAAPSFPRNMSALGDSVTQAFDSCCYYGSHPEHSWSTGYDPGDGVTSHYERLAAQHMLSAYNDSVVGSRSVDLAGQAQQTGAQRADYVTVMIGANDLCTSSPATMTSTADFDANISAGLTTLHQQRPTAKIFVSSIPDLYQLWSLFGANPAIVEFWHAAGICQSMLSPADTEADRQAVVAQEQAFNQILARDCAQYSTCRFDNDAVYNNRFTASQVSTLDFFHPSISGQAALADITWATSWYS